MRLKTRDPLADKLVREESVKFFLGQWNQPDTDFEKIILLTDADRESLWTGQCVDLYLRLW